jgi:hypothetical protein
MPVFGKNWVKPPETLPPYLGSTFPFIQNMDSYLQKDIVAKDNRQIIHKS